MFSTMKLRKTYGKGINVQSYIHVEAFTCYHHAAQDVLPRLFVPPSMLKRM